MRFRICDSRYGRTVEETCETNKTRLVWAQQYNPSPDVFPDSDRPGTQHSRASVFGAIQEAGGSTGSPHGGVTPTRPDGDDGVRSLDNCEYPVARDVCNIPSYGSESGVSRT